jgi:hypothetical protein
LGTGGTNVYRMQRAGLKGVMTLAPSSPSQEDNDQLEGLGDDSASGSGSVRSSGSTKYALTWQATGKSSMPITTHRTFYPVTRQGTLSRTIIPEIRPPSLCVAVDPSPGGAQGDAGTLTLLAHRVSVSPLGRRGCYLQPRRPVLSWWRPLVARATPRGDRSCAPNCPSSVRGPSPGESGCRRPWRRHPSPLMVCSSLSPARVARVGRCSPNQRHRRGGGVEP